MIWKSCVREVSTPNPPVFQRAVPRRSTSFLCCLCLFSCPIIEAETCARPVSKSPSILVPPIPLQMERVYDIYSGSMSFAVRTQHSGDEQPVPRSGVRYHSVHTRSPRHNCFGGQSVCVCNLQMVWFETFKD